jgi:hypothetical protein
MTYDEALEYQLEEWVAGRPWHNPYTKFGTGGECCPDFSCCKPDLLWDVALREEFAEATRNGQDEKVHAMLMQSLGALLEHEGKRDEVFVVGMDDAVEQ